MWQYRRFVAGGGFEAHGPFPTNSLSLSLPPLVNQKTGPKELMLSSIQPTLILASRWAEFPKQWSYKGPIYDSSVPLVSLSHQTALTHWEALHLTLYKLCCAISPTYLGYAYLHILEENSRHPILTSRCTKPKTANNQPATF